VKLVKVVSRAVETATVRSEQFVCCVKLKNGGIARPNVTNIYVVGTRCFISKIRYSEFVSVQAVKAYRGSR
jgi:hypothetical protein